MSVLAKVWPLIASVSDAGSFYEPAEDAFSVLQAGFRVFRPADVEDAVSASAYAG